MNLFLKIIRSIQAMVIFLKGHQLFIENRFSEANRKFEKRIINPYFNKEYRYIGAMFPFSPSKETMESRIIFILVKDADTLYKITVHGVDAWAENTNLQIIKNALPDSLRCGMKEQFDGSRKAQIKEEIKFYERVKWEKADNLIIQEVSRTSQLDKLRFRLIINGSN